MLVESMNAKLTCLDYSASPGEMLLDVLPLVIGRSCEAQICLDDRWVSRRHCELDVCEGVLVVRDLGSKYGTFVNGRRITQAKLLPGDMLSVGLSNYVAAYTPSPNDASSHANSPAVESCAPYELVG